MDGTRNPSSADDLCARLGTASARVMLGVCRSADFSAHGRVIETGGDENVP
jgi:hypothetical protein